MTEPEDYTCRICLDTGSRNDFIAPCKCAGSQKWVHRSCLDRWRSVREDKAFSKCTECQAHYKLICVTNDTFNSRMMRRVKFGCLLTRDIGLVVVASQVVIGLLGFIVYLFDSHGHHLINIFRMSGRPFLFYYLIGALLSLSIIGMVFSCLPRPDQGADVVCCTGCDGCDGCHAVYCYPYPVGPQEPCCFCCGNLDCLGGGGAVPCCECGECCSTAALGEEAFICVIGILIIFAILGVFYCMAMGAYYVQYVTQRHYHVLEKLNLTQEYKVADLAEGAMAVDYIPPDVSEGTGEGGGGVVHSALHSSQGGAGIELVEGRRPYVDEESKMSDGETADWGHVSGGFGATSNYSRIVNDDSSHGGSYGVSIINPNIGMPSSALADEQSAESQSLLTEGQRRELVHMGLL